MMRRFAKLGKYHKTFRTMVDTIHVEVADGKSVSRLIRGDGGDLFDANRDRFENITLAYRHE
jgi:hypothetical protein